MTEPQVCDEGERGLILPLGGDAEQRLPHGVRIPLYFIGLMWCFMAVALIADKFMGAIERVTASQYRKKLPSGRVVSVLVWNETVANLTLMALGSSAPEILLAVIELVLINNFFSGSLGPSTIVGSAAFNLFVITAVCIYVIPEEDKKESNEIAEEDKKNRELGYRKIKEVPVYIVTAIFSVFAYVWLLVVILLITPEIIDIGEGIVTFLFFPVLVAIAYLADRGYFTSGDEGGTQLEKRRGSMTKQELAELNQQIKDLEQKGASAEQIERMLCATFLPRTSRATRRVQATRRLTGGRRVEVADTSSAKEAFRPLYKLGKSISSVSSSSRKVHPIDESSESDSDLSTDGPKVASRLSLSKEPTGVKFEFENPKLAVLENVGAVELVVVRRGNLKGTATVNYKTRDGTALQGSDYQSAEGTLTFNPGDITQSFKVEIVDDDEFEEDEEFYVTLSEPTNTAGRAVLAKQSEATVLIIDDDLAGEFVFPEDTVSVIQTDANQEFFVNVERRGGATGQVSCQYKTEDGSALAGRDFEYTEGELIFENGVMSRQIPLVIKGRGRFEYAESFRVIVNDAKGGATFHKDSDGGEECIILTVEIKVNPDDQKKLDRMFSALRVNWDRTVIGHTNWFDQFKDAIFANGGEESSCMDWTVHILCIPWKLIFALVPPLDFCGGWLCFFCSLGMIGFVTLLIGELAALLGCVMQIGPEITAITLVALGTSLPDTFASKEAASKDPYADASIVNVTGSNSVNVFLGLGLPYTIGAIYWAVMGQSDDWLDKYENTKFFTECPNGCFVVEAGGLAFSVGVFSFNATVALVVLALRRRWYKGELGGPRTSKIVSSIFFAGLWGIYILASILYIVLTG